MVNEISSFKSIPSSIYRIDCFGDMEHLASAIFSANIQSLQELYKADKKDITIEYAYTIIPTYSNLCKDLLAACLKLPCAQSVGSYYG